MLFLLAFVWCIQISSATYVISVYGDVYEDKDFFTKTYPWLIDNIGGEITVDYYLQYGKKLVFEELLHARNRCGGGTFPVELHWFYHLAVLRDRPQQRIRGQLQGSGRYSVPQMCALNEMRLNTFVQAQYLKCEAEGNPSEHCLCATGIDPFKYKQCVLTRGSLASLAASKYSQLGVDARPVIEIGYKNTIFGVQDTWYLKKICTIFGDNPPRGCVQPFACNATQSYSDKSSVVQFDCQKNFLNMSISVTYEDFPDPPTTSTTTTSFTSSTSPAVIATSTSSFPSTTINEIADFIDVF